MDAVDEVVHAKKETVYGEKRNVECKKYKKLLVLLPDTVVDPGAVVVHLLDTPLAHRAVVSSLWLDAAALGALEYHLSLLKSHQLDILLGSIPPWHGPWVCKHSPQMREDC